MAPTELLRSPPRTLNPLPQDMTILSSDPLRPLKIAPSRFRFLVCPDDNDVTTDNHITHTARSSLRGSRSSNARAARTISKINAALIEPLIAMQRKGSANARSATGPTAHFGGTSFCGQTICLIYARSIATAASSFGRSRNSGHGGEAMVEDLYGDSIVLVGPIAKTDPVK